MLKTRCQICGRKKSLKKSGGIAHHHVDSEPCPGTGYPPIEADDKRLIQYAQMLRAEYKAAYDAIRSLEQARANWIEPALYVRRAQIGSRFFKIENRLKRHNDWPSRYERSIQRQMERQGYAWADPPPAYLVDRQRTPLEFTRNE